MGDFITKLILFCSILVGASAAAAPYRVLGVSSPRSVANGLPFTYTVRVRATGELKLRDLAARLSMEGAYRDGKTVLLPENLTYVFPYSETEGLLQFVFKVPANFPKANLTFFGELVYSDGDVTERQAMIPLQVAAVGPWN